MKKRAIVFLLTLVCFLQFDLKTSADGKSDTIIIETEERTIDVNNVLPKAGVACLLEPSFMEENTTIEEQKSNETLVLQETANQTYIPDVNRWNIELTEEEINLLAKIVWVEARGEPDEGQQAVVVVIFNRMKDEYYQGTLYEVLSADRQFASWELKDEAAPTEKEYNNIYAVLNNECSEEIMNMNKLYFSTSTSNSNAIKIKHHYFW